jgi:hypothetical protein
VAKKKKIKHVSVNIPNRVKKIADQSITRNKLGDMKADLKNRRIQSKTAANKLTPEGIIADEIFPTHIVSKDGKKGAAIASLTGKEHLGSASYSASMEDLSTFMAGKGINIHRDDFDTLDLFAQHIISLLNTQVYELANLTKHERFILLRYFYRTNPILGRVIDLHTEIPLSKLRLQPPQDCPKIVRDFMMQYYEKIFNRLSFAENLKDLVLHYHLLGEGYGLVEDYFDKYASKLQDIDDMSTKAFDYKDDDLRFIERIEKEYEADPDKVELSDRKKYFEKKFLGFFNQGYIGPERFRVLKFYDITEYFSNDEIGFEAIRHRISDGVQTILQDHSVPLSRTNENVEDYDCLLELGYTEGFVELLKQNRESRDIIIDNDIYSGFPFLLVFKRYESTSLAYRVLDACLAWDAANRALKARVKTIGRIGRVVTAPELGLDQLNALIAEVTKMIEDPNYAVVANYDINWQEVNSFLKEELNNLITANDSLKQIIATGMGIPESLLSGESQYTGDNIKVEILNTQYFAFKVKFQNLLEDKFMKPIALRKGFIGLDEWGNLRLYHPKLTFSLLNLRSAEYFEMLMNLYQKGSLNIDIIYDLLNLDGDGITHALKQDLWTLKNDKFNVIVEDLLHAAAEKMAQETDFALKIMEGLGLNKLSTVQKAEQELAQQMGGEEGGDMGGGLGGGSMPPMGGGMEDLGGDLGEDLGGGAPEPAGGEGGTEAPTETPKIDIPVPAGQ